MRPDDRQLQSAWDPPGPGVWEHDRSHQVEPFPHLLCETLPHRFSAGSARFAERYGLPLARLDAATVQGWFYVRPVLAGAPDRPGPSKVPPPLVMKAIIRLVPELRRRERAAAAAVADRRWTDDARQWEDERPTWVERCRARQHVSIATLDDTALGDEVERCLELVGEMYESHFASIGMSLGIGRFVACAEAWGVSVDDLAGLLKGGSPASAAAGHRLRSIAGLLRAAGLDLAMLTDAEPVEAVAAIRAASPDAAAALDEYLDHHGFRMTDPTMATPLLIERPQVAVRGILRAATELEHGIDPYLSIDPGPVRERIPPGERARFDALLAEARTCYAASDDNTGHLYWVGGVAQRAIHEAGRRLAARGTLADPRHVVELSRDQLLALLRSDPIGADVAQQAADRYDRRQAMSGGHYRPPAHLGGAPEPPPDPSVLPPGMRQVMEAFAAVRVLKSAEDPAVPAGGHATQAGLIVARGHAIGTASHTGRACIVGTAEEAFARLEPGAVLVCPVTNPAYDPLFAIAGAVVTEMGGPIGHTAVMAREFGLPALVGVVDHAIADGEPVTVIPTG